SYPIDSKSEQSSFPVLADPVRLCHPAEYLGESKSDLAWNEIRNCYQEHAKRNQNELGSSSGFEIMSSDTHLQLTASLHPNSEDDGKKPCKKHSSVRLHELCDEKL